ncbi:hypothetical protein EIN_247440 [Entamoeba invadens IP1]|uniref:Uncharacterized protein n=1 Tax=Entamoeba invadens IP1 TaxID=370355 RepID=A0A0A1UE08_ENTIV|nr:hypothetical protein EIN_247440 [Entamoeba invadens IP1]ELP94830.1 hypothetical protein EIN_247440 [Entamoeba invadens IP1]|eukprot:XP_004261601.1 hypothetical protein EIN_247440 [Entamoeba invadens IP1]
MERLITLSLSIHYITIFGEEVYINFDNGLSKKMVWNENHVWTVTLSIHPRTTRWWYSISNHSQTTRVEDLELPREYDFDTKDKYFQIVDHWDDYYTVVTPINSSNLIISKAMNSSLIKRYLIPRYTPNLVRNKSPHNNFEPKPSTKYNGCTWGFFDDSALLEKKTKTLTVYSVLRGD